MPSLVAAVMAPRTDNRRRVTGSSGRRREGGERERQRPNMSRRVFTSAVLLLVVMMCCGISGAAQATEVGNNAVASAPSGSALTDAITAEESASGGVEELQWVDLFVPRTTQVLSNEGTDSSRRDSFVSPSLVSAGGVIAAFAEGHINAKHVVEGGQLTKPSSDVVAEYIDSAWEWSTLVEKVKKEETWRAHTVVGKTEGKESLDVVRHLTTTMKGNKVFLLVGSNSNTHCPHTHIYMPSLVAAVMAPRTDNRRRVTGSSGRRREGGERERQRPNMSRRVFTSAVLLLVVMMCCGISGAAQATEVGNNAVASAPSGSALTDAITAEESASGGVEELQWVDLFVPRTTQVLSNEGTDSSRRDSFVSPSLVSAGGVIAAFAEGHINAKHVVEGGQLTKPSSDVVAEYIDSAWEWSTLVEKVKKEETWRAHTVLGKTEGKESLDVVRHLTTTMK
ncbi:trans-sialidase, putative, partial [Trypanosoma cruzi]